RYARGGEGRHAGRRRPNDERGRGGDRAWSYSCGESLAAPGEAGVGIAAGGCGVVPSGADGCAAGARVRAGGSGGDGGAGWDEATGACEREPGPMTLVRDRVRRRCPPESIEGQPLRTTVVNRLTIAAYRPGCPLALRW